MLLSVIVPVYNAGEYLEPCIESLLALPWEKEIIVVDDGSTDNAIAKLKIKSEKLKIIAQRNQGVSAARNAGLKIAKGDWVWFVDSDDVVSEGKRKREKGKIETDTLPVSDAFPSEASLLLLPFIWEENGIAKQYEARDGEIPYNLWRCLFRRDWIEKNHLHFTVGRKYAEDQEFILQYLLKFSVIITMALDGPVYHYTMRASGAMMQSGVRWKKRWDLWCVLCHFVFKAIIEGKIAKLWVRKQIKRLTKNLIII